jgi:hypothetical protein
MRKLLALLFVLICILVPASISHGQSEPEAGSGLMMENQEDASKSKLIKEGHKIKVWMYDGYTHKGDLTRVTDSSYVIGTLELPFSRTEKLKLVKGEGSKIAGIVGIIMGFVGVLVGFLMGLGGAAMIDSADSNLDGCFVTFFGVMILVLGIALGGIGFVFLLVGLIGYAVGKAAGRSFRFDKGKWKITKSDK